MYEELDPQRAPNTKVNRNDEQPLGFNRDLATKIRKKRRRWQRYMETRNESDRREYVKIRNQVRQLSRKMKRQVEMNIAKEAKSNNKRFWKYVNKKTTVRQGIPDLQVPNSNAEDNSITTTDEEKAGVLSDYFASVFTREDVRHIPRIQTRQVEEFLTQVTFTPQMVSDKIDN